MSSSSIPSAPGGDGATTSSSANADPQRPMMPGAFPQHATPMGFPPPNSRAISSGENKTINLGAVEYHNNNSASQSSPITTFGNNNGHPATQPGVSGTEAAERPRYMTSAPYAAPNASTDTARLIGQPIPSPQQVLQMKQQQQLRQMKLQQQQRSQQLFQQQQGDATKETSGNASWVSPQKFDFSNVPPHLSQLSSGENNFHQRSLNGSMTAPNMSNNNNQQQQSFQMNSAPSARFQPPDGPQNRMMTNAPAAVSAQAPPMSTNEAPSTSSPTKSSATLPSSKAKPSSSGNLSAKSHSHATGSATTGGGAAPPATLPPEQVVRLLSRCNWIDKTVWASRQLLGGQSVNGFMRATATVQRIKKQRARQNVRSGKKTAPVSASGGDLGSTPAATNQSLEEQQAEEEILKKDVMNARTAKKIKQELDAGIQFCVILHDTIRAIVQQMDPSVPPIEPLSSSPMSRNTSRAGMPGSSAPHNAHPPPTQNGTSGTPKIGNSKKPVGSPNVAAPTVKAPVAPPHSPLHISQDKFGLSTQTSPSNSTGSTLRRYRKTKIPPSGEVLIQLPEIDEVTGKRHSTKKDHPHRLSDVIRFRALRKGDPVAARVTSRDLWILACVVKDYPGINMTPLEFVRLSDARREQLFKEKVLIQDVEERDGGTAAAVLVSRSLVLPLPRSIAEAAEWGNHYRFFKKGSRVYAMYPNTTALYTATVVDCTTYCLGDEDVIVVEFDGDEPDNVTGKIPACHIPARFVTLIPKEFPGAQGPSSSTNKRKRSSPVVPSMDEDIMNGVLDDLNFDGDLPGLDDLDFDLLGDS